MLTCQKCGNDFPTSIRINGKVHSSNHRKNCFECSPFKPIIPNGICLNCSLPLVGNQTKYCSKKCKHQHHRKNHKENYNRNARKKRLKNKRKAVNCLGGKCSICKKEYDLACYVFHHSHGKEIGMNQLLCCSWEKISKELDKCILTCSNCHHEIHYPENITSKYQRYYRKRKIQAIEYLGGKCDECGYNKYNGALSFHHKEKKSFALAGHLYYSWERIKPELDKCILLCENCHRFSHKKVKGSGDEI